MICVVCLAQGRKLLPSETEALAASALTVANGQAVCREHLDAVAGRQNETHGHLSLHALLGQL